MAHSKTRSAVQWEYLYDTLQADVCLLTEMCNPEETNCPFPHYKWHGLSPEIPYMGSGIASRYPLKDFPVASPGAVSAAKLIIDNQPTIFLASIYGTKAKENGSYCADMHRYISELTPMLLGKIRSRTIIGGDWNIDIGFDGKAGHTQSETRLFLERIRDFNMSDCLQNIEKPVRTLRWKWSMDSDPFQIDHCYARNGMKIASAEVVENATVCELSDHNPLVIEFDI
jgi:exonuclease III